MRDRDSEINDEPLHPVQDDDQHHRGRSNPAMPQPNRPPGAALLESLDLPTIRTLGELRARLTR